MTGRGKLHAFQILHRFHTRTVVHSRACELLCAPTSTQGVHPRSGVVHHAPPRAAAERDVAAGCNGAVFFKLSGRGTPRFRLQKAAAGRSSPSPCARSLDAPHPCGGLRGAAITTGSQPVPPLPPRHSLAPTDFLPKPEGETF